MTTGRNEDYLEAIYGVVSDKGYAKVRDVAKILDVGPPSVTEMFRKLAEDGYINYEKYSGVTLTQKGKKVAEEIIARHETLKEFLIIFGADEGTAELDACEIEHSVHPETMVRLTKFVEFVRGAEEETHLLAHFNHFVETGERIDCKPGKGQKCTLEISGKTGTSSRSESRKPRAKGKSPGKKSGVRG